MSYEEEERKRKKKIEEADDILEGAKALVDEHVYQEAKEEYRKAIDIFKELGWFEQADVLYEEIKNLEEYKRDYIKQKKWEEEKEQREQQYFTQRLERLQKTEEIAPKVEAPSQSPELKRKLDKIDLILNKARKEEQKGLYNRVIERYKIIIELYNSIPTEQMEVRDKISEFENKITELKSKL
jgi:hypothetical protein